MIQFNQNILATATPALLPEYLEVRDDGALVYRGHRVALHLVLDSIERGESTEAIQHEFPTIPREWINATRTFREENREFCSTQLAVARRKEAEIPSAAAKLAELRRRAQDESAN